ncbi:589_t:CDS:10, partial [Racocetra fulgida]
MCGILFRLRQSSSSNDGNHSNSFHKDLWNQLMTKNTQHQFSESLDNFELDFFGAVLHLRGKSVIKQPLIDNDQNVLLWNGEIFDGLEVPFGENDTICLSTTLKDSEKISDKINDNNGVLKVLRMIEGRRSLLWHIPTSEEDNFFLTSVGCKTPRGSEHVEAMSYFQEVPADESVSNPFVPVISLEMEQAINQMIDVLGDSVRRRVFDIPRIGGQQDASVAILFSGGLDCICLAALADKYIPHGEPIDLLNVKSDKSKSIYDVPDRLTGRQGVEELRIWNFVEVDVPYEQVCQCKVEILELMSPSDTIMDLEMIKFESKARVILIGVGADELLAGYSRHREVFKKGTGEKLLLRHVARRLGLINASMLWKRAIQFGAKTARMTNEKKDKKGDMK